MTDMTMMFERTFNDLKRRCHDDAKFANEPDIRLGQHIQDIIAEMRQVNWEPREWVSVVKATPVKGNGR